MSAESASRVRPDDQQGQVRLEDCSLFQGIGSDVLARIKALVEEREFPHDATIFCEGEPAQELFLLASGSVALDYTLPADPSVMLPITRVSPGDIFAWSGLANNQSLTARARTEGTSRAYVIPAEPLRNILAAHPDAGYLVMTRLTELIASRLRDTRVQLRWLQSSC